MKTTLEEHINELKKILNEAEELNTNETVRKLEEFITNYERKSKDTVLPLA